MTMRTSKVSFVAVTVGCVLALAGCGAPEAAPVLKLSAPAALPLAADSANCTDGRPINATLPPTNTSGSFPAGSAMKDIQNRGYLRVATNGDVLNWGATNTKTGDPEGYDVDLAAEVARALGSTRPGPSTP